MCWSRIIGYIAVLVILKWLSFVKDLISIKYSYKILDKNNITLARIYVQFYYKYSQTCKNTK